MHAKRALTAARIVKKSSAAYFSEQLEERSFVLRLAHGKENSVRHGPGIPRGNS